MSADRAREYVLGMYPGAPGWRKKVAKMSDAQVTAIFLKAQREPQHEGPKPDEPDPEEPNIPF